MGWLYLVALLRGGADLNMDLPALMARQGAFLHRREGLIC